MAPKTTNLIGRVWKIKPRPATGATRWDAYLAEQLCFVTASTLHDASGQKKRKFSGPPEPVRHRTLILTGPKVGKQLWFSALRVEREATMDELLSLADIFAINDLPPDIVAMYQALCGEAGAADK